MNLSKYSSSSSSFGAMQIATREPGMPSPRCSTGGTSAGPKSSYLSEAASSIQGMKFGHLRLKTGTSWRTPTASKGRPRCCRHRRTGRTPQIPTMDRLRPREYAVATTEPEGKQSVCGGPPATSGTCATDAGALTHSMSVATR